MFRRGRLVNVDAILVKIVLKCATECLILKYKYIQNPCFYMKCVHPGPYPEGYLNRTAPDQNGACFVHYLKLLSRLGKKYRHPEANCLNYIKIL